LILGDNPFIEQDSGEAERCFRWDAERHSGINPNTVGAWERWPFDFAKFGFFKEKRSS
jgi:hypothetical protein